MDYNTFGAARSYVDDSIADTVGVLAGKNCTIASTTKTGNITTVVFNWTADDGTSKTTSIQVADGVKGDQGEIGLSGADGASIIDITINELDHLICTLSNGTEVDAGLIAGVSTSTKVEASEINGNIKINEVETVVYDSTEITNSLQNKLDITDEATYTIVKTTSESSVAQYHLQKTVNGVVEAVGELINIPKDLVIESGTVEACTVANIPVDGYVIGDKYIDLLLANSNNEHVYILATDLVVNLANGITYDNANSELAATNVQSAIDELDNSKSDTTHTHNYAASDSAGGAATSAKKLDNTSAIGSVTQPVYFNDSGVPVPTNYTVEKSVPSNAVFTDTTYNLATTSANGLMSSTDKKKINIAEPQFAYCTTDASSTGYYKITINNASAWMMSFDVRIYHWYHCYNLYVSGYNYGVNHWSSPRVITTSSTSPVKYMPVTFGYNLDGKLWFAVPAAPYTGILINDMNQGMSAPITDFSGLFTVEKVTELTGTTQTTVNAYRPVYVNEGLVVTTVPTSATATGIKGDIAYDANYMYVCTDANVWKRTALSSW